MAKKKVNKCAPMLRNTKSARDAVGLFKQPDKDIKQRKATTNELRQNLKQHELTISEGCRYSFYQFEDGKKVILEDVPNETAEQRAARALKVYIMQEVALLDANRMSVDTAIDAEQSLPIMRCCSITD